MCTVVFIPDNKKIFFASVRDESPLRERAMPPDIFTTGNVSFLSPKDPLAGGTWIGGNDHGNVIILLNGGFENHQRKNYYRKSRGIIVSELLAIKSPAKEWGKMNMKDIEPFTLIAWNKKNLFRLTWDGTEKHMIKLDGTISHIWSSATLYNDEVRYQRAILFKKWIAATPLVSKKSVLDFFETFTDPTNGFIMNRNEKIKSLSYTTIEITDNTTEMNYHDLFSTTAYNRSITLLGEMKIA
jgi:Transport and Golgi organisation 2